MSSIALLPHIICSSCGSVIGDKFITFNTLVDCGYSNMEAFINLDIISYCCRMKFTNPIIVCNPHDSKQRKIKKSEQTSPTSDKVIIIEENIFSHLTANIIKEIPIVNDNFTSDEELLNSIKREVVQLEEEYIPFNMKVIDVNLITVANNNGKNKIHKIYNSI